MVNELWRRCAKERCWRRYWSVFCLLKSRNRYPLALARPILRRASTYFGSVFYHYHRNGSNAFARQQNNYQLILAALQEVLCQHTAHAAPTHAFYRWNGYRHQLTMALQLQPLLGIQGVEGRP